MKEQHYNILCSALVWAFGQALQPGFDDEVRAAWTAVIRAVNEEMKIGAAAVPSNYQNEGAPQPSVGTKKLDGAEWQLDWPNMTR